MLKQSIIRDLKILLKLFKSILRRLQIQVVTFKTSKEDKSSIWTNKNRLKIQRNLYSIAIEAQN